MAVSDRKIRITITIHRNVHDHLKCMSNNFHFPVARLATNFIYMGLDEAKILEKVGSKDALISTKIFRQFVQD